MNLEQYAAQQPQPQAAQAVGDPGRQLDDLTARMEAARLTQILALTRKGLENKANPSAILAQLAGPMFGPDSPEAKKIAEIVSADRLPGGLDMALAMVEQRRRLLKRQKKRLEDQLQDVNRWLGDLYLAESDLIGDYYQTADHNRDMREIMTFYLALDQTEGCSLEHLGGLLARYKRNPAAMGLLYGIIVDLIQKKFDTLNLTQQQDLLTMKDRAMEAITGQTSPEPRKGP